MAEQIIKSQGKRPIPINGQVAEREAWGFLCSCGFLSRDWPTKKTAGARAKAHENEHQTGELMLSTRDFLDANGHEGWNSLAPATGDSLEVKAAELLEG